MGTPEFVYNQADMWVAWAPLLQLASEVREVLWH